MNAVAGKPGRPIDKGNRYKAACHQFASDYGFIAKEVYDCWLDLVRERRSWPRTLAEWQALRDVRRSFYCPGGDNN